MHTQRAHRGEFLGQHIDGAVETDGQNVVILVERGEDVGHLHIRPKPPDACLDRLFQLRVNAHDARQREQAERLFQRDRLAIHAFGERGAAGFDLAARLLLALLGIQPIRAATDGDLLAGGRMGAEIAHPLLQRGRCLVLATIDCQPAGEGAIRVVRAADERAMPPQTQPKPPLAAGRAHARVGAVLTGGEEMRAELLIQRVDDVGDLQVFGLGDRRREIPPEGMHHRAPIGLARRNLVELIFQPGGEAGVDIAFEKAGQKGGDEAAAVFRHEATLVDFDVVAVLQHRDDRGIGGRAANAEFFHLLDQAGFRIARRRLGEMLLGGDGFGGHRIVLAHRRQHAVVVVVLSGGVLVHFFAIELEEAVKGDNRAIGAQHRRCRVFRLGEVHSDLIQLCRRHLRGTGALPDQLIHPALIMRQMPRDIVRRAGDVGRADGFVRLLGVLGLGCVFARLGRDVIGAEAVTHMAANGVDGLACHRNTIGSHIGDQPDRIAVDIDTFIKLLRQTHDLLGGQAELA